MSETPIFVALDGMSLGGAEALARELRDFGAYFKINDLLDLHGIEAVRRIGAYGFVFADAKLHDIPNTVFNRAQHYGNAGAAFLSVHTTGGIPMMQAALEATEGFGTRLLGITALTSLDDEQVRHIYGKEPNGVVWNLALDAANAGIYGIVCSGNELDELDVAPVSNLGKIIPGIRPAFALGENDDQARVTTPAKAIKAGADYLVIGRPITKADDPVAAMRMIVQEILDAR